MNEILHISHPWRFTREHDKTFKAHRYYAVAIHKYIAVGILWPKRGSVAFS